MSTPMKRTNWMNGDLVVLPLLFNSGGTEVDTGFAMPTNSIIYHNEIWVLVDTLEATGSKTLAVGILSTQAGGNATGLITGLSTATAGLIKPTVTISQGTNAHYISAATFGILFLAAATKGANTSGQGAVPVFTPYISDGIAMNISYTPTAGTTFVGRLVFRLRQLPV